MDNYNKELYHYGVLGMKWGVRRHAKKLARSTRRFHRDGAASGFWTDGDDYRTDMRRERNMRRLAYDADQKAKKYDQKAASLSTQKQTALTIRRISKLKMKSDRVKAYAEEGRKLQKSFRKLSNARIAEISRRRIIGTMATVDLDRLY